MPNFLFPAGKHTTESRNSSFWSARRMLSFASSAAGLGILGISVYDSAVNKAPVAWKNVAAGSGLVVTGVCSYPYKRGIAQQDSLSNHINLHNLRDKDFSAKKMSVEREAQLKIELAFLNDKTKQKMELVTAKPLGGVAKKEKESAVHESPIEFVRFGVTPEGRVITGIAREDGGGFNFAPEMISSNMSGAADVVREAVQRAAQNKSSPSLGDKAVLALGIDTPRRPGTLPASMRFGGPRFGSWKSNAEASTNDREVVMDKMRKLVDEIEQISIDDKDNKIERLVKSMCEMAKENISEVSCAVHFLKDKMREIGQFNKTDYIANTQVRKITLHKNWLRLNCESNEFPVNAYRPFMPLLKAKVMIAEDLVEICRNLGATIDANKESAMIKRMNEAVAKP